jgi:adenylate cyclase
MFTDMVGYSALSQADEAEALAVLERHNRMLRPIFSAFHGREIKTAGDAFLVEFESVLDAARCGVEVQRVLHEYNLSSPVEWKIRIRIGIHVGDVVQADGDVLGDAVNIASRIEPLADPEGICLTQQVYDQLQNKIPVSFVKLAPVSLKNIHVPMTVYKVVQPWDTRPAATSPAESSIGHRLAVLPFSNISPDPNDEYFADGLTEEVITVLSQVRDLSVIARTSVMPYKTAPRSVAQVGAELGVDTVLEGSVRKSGKRIRITLQLIDVPTQRHLWATSYNREIDDVFAVQTDIAERTAEALRLEFTKTDRPGVRGRPTANVEAYDFFLRGLVAASDAKGGSIDEAIQSFEHATELDPGFAEAFATWANLYVSVAGDFRPMRDVMPPARKLAARALELDPDSSDAYAALGNIAFQFDHDWQLAEAYFKRAIAINPSNVTAFRFLGMVLLAQNRFDEARDVVRTAIRLDPGGYYRGAMAMIDTATGDYDAAVRYHQTERDRDADSIGTHIVLGFVYLAAGRREDALTEADTPLTGADAVERFDHALLNALVGRPDAARAVAAEAERGEAKSYTSATHLAMLYSAIGDKARALDLLEKDAREGDQVLWLWFRGVWFDPIRDDPRFIELLRHYGLPTGRARPPPSPRPRG